MTFSILTCLYFGIISSLLFVSNPLMLGTWMILLALLVSLFISVTLRAWYGLLIFLIYVGGLIVIFSYFTALIPNQQINFNQIFKGTIIFFFQAIILTHPLKINIVISTHQSTSICLLYFPENIPLLIYFALLLFLALIVVVKVSTQYRGPLRPFNTHI